MLIHTLSLYLSICIYLYTSTHHTISCASQWKARDTHTHTLYVYTHINIQYTQRHAPHNLVRVPVEGLGPRPRDVQDLEGALGSHDGQCFSCPFSCRPRGGAHLVCFGGGKGKEWCLVGSECGVWWVVSVLDGFNQTSMGTPKKNTQKKRLSPTENKIRFKKRNSRPPKKRSSPTGKALEKKPFSPTNKTSTFFTLLLTPKKLVADGHRAVLHHFNLLKKNFPPTERALSTTQKAP